MNTRAARRPSDNCDVEACRRGAVPLSSLRLTSLRMKSWGIFKSEDGAELAIRSSPTWLADFFRNLANVEALIAQAKASGKDEFGN